MARTRQAARAISSPVQGREYDSLSGDEAERDPLMGTASHQSVASAHSERGDSGGHQGDPITSRTQVSPAETPGGQGSEDKPPPVTSTVTPNPYSDPTFLEQLVKAVAAGMAAGASNSTPRAERVITLVQWVKGMREMGCTTYSGEEDAEVAGHWLRKVERVIDQMQVPEETRVDCVTQLLTESAHSWWETIRERRAGEDLRWGNFREEFEERYYSWQHRKEKEQEFLDLKQGNMTVLEYERRFQDLSIFATTHLSTEHHRVERFRDGLRQELKLILVAMQFQSIRELVRAAQGIERVMNDMPRQTSEQSQTTGFKRRDFTPPIGRNPPPKKGKSGSSFGPLPKKGGSFVHSGSSGGVRRVNVGGSVGGQTRQGASVIGDSMEHRDLSTRYA